YVVLGSKVLSVVEVADGEIGRFRIHHYLDARAFALNSAFGLANGAQRMRSIRLQLDAGKCGDSTSSECGDRIRYTVDSEPDHLTVGNIGGYAHRDFVRPS